MIFRSIFTNNKFILGIFVLNLVFIDFSLFSKEEEIFEHLNFSNNFPGLVFGVAPKSSYEDSITGEKLGASYVFTVKMPMAIQKNIPHILGYYKGEQLKFDSNFCIINEDLKTSSFTIVVTSDISRKAEEKNVYCLERKENLPCKLFYVNQIEKSSKSENSNDYDIEWHIEKESNIESMPKKLPDNSIVILLDPDYVDDLKVIQDQKNIEINGKAVIIKMPALVLKLKDNDIKAFKDSFDNALLASVDQKPIHRDSSESLAISLQGSTILSMRVN